MNENELKGNDYILLFVRIILIIRKESQIDVKGGYLNWG